MNPAAKRLMHDIVKAHELEEDGIFIHFDESNIKTVYALIIGPEDTPYFGGFYLFKLEISDQYPFTYPEGTYLTTYGDIRFHPNYYACGKICLSILGTWGQCSWTPSQTLSSIFLSMKSIMTKYALKNEPEYDINIGSEDHVNYDKYVEYWNIAYAYLQIGTNYRNMKWIPEEFHEIIRKEFEKNRGIIKDRLEELSKSDDEGSRISTFYSGQDLVLNYKELLDKFN